MILKRGCVSVCSRPLAGSQTNNPTQVHLGGSRGLGPLFFFCGALRARLLLPSFAGRGRSFRGLFCVPHARMPGPRVCVPCAWCGTPTVACAMGHVFSCGVDPGYGYLWYHPNSVHWPLGYKHLINTSPEVDLLQASTYRHAFTSISPTTG
jgi:hypothetical protein